MKPTVISNNGNNSSGNTPVNTPGNGGAGQPDANNNPNFINDNSFHTGTRHQFPHFQGFSIDPDMDEIFSDAGIRSRLGRMPFGFGSRKRVNDPNRYFDDDDNDFFSNFGTLGRRRQQQQPQQTPERKASGGGVFDHIPPEFRQYMPDNFDTFSSPTTMHTTPPSPRSTRVQQQPQYYEAYVQPGPGSPTNQRQKPKLCDAAIQTEYPPDQEVDQENKPHRVQPLKQHGLRNTVDLGQISPPENDNTPRAQSAPPSNVTNQSFTTSQTAQADPDSSHVHTSPTAYAYVPPPQHQRWQAQPQSPPTSQHESQIPHPPPRPHPQSQQKYYQSTAHIPTSPQPNPQQEGGAYIRTVPIFVEGRSEPVINEHKHTFESQPQPHFEQKQFYSQQEPQQYVPNQNQQQQHSSQYQPYHVYQQRHQQQQSPQQQQQQATHQQPRPTPLNTQQANAAPNQQSPVPNTPQTTATIEKIQSIQRDVLDLMSKVEKFTGMKSDKEYMYLDEMLTRNLLKLDTIDTQGKERIRLARKEAIKCIQASINVLEAKAEENARKSEQKFVMNSQEMNEAITEPQQEQLKETTENKTTETTHVPLDEASNAKLPDVVPLPPPPERSGNIESQQQNEANEDKLVAAVEDNNENKSAESVKNGQREQKTEKVVEEVEHDKTDETNSISVDEQKQDENIKIPSTVPDVAPDVTEQQQQQQDKKSESLMKDSRPKSPKKKIVKKIVKKSDKKGSTPSSTSSASPPDGEQKEEIKAVSSSSSEAPASVAEISN